MVKLLKYVFGLDNDQTFSLLDSLDAPCKTVSLGVI